jgi:hypothetical protein
MGRRAALNGDLFVIDARAHADHLRDRQSVRRSRAPEVFARGRSLLDVAPSPAFATDRTIY